MLSSQTPPVGDGVRLAVEEPPEIVRGEDCKRGDVRESVRAEETDVRVSTEEDSRVADEALQTPYGLLEVIIEAVTGLLFRNDWDREILGQPFRRADRAGTGPSSAVRRRECLVEVQVNDVETHIAGPRLAEESVHVRPVIIHQASGVVDRLRYLDDLPLKEAEGVWNREHHPRGTLGGQLLHRLRAHQPRLFRWHLDDLEAAHRGARRVCPVSRIGDEYLILICEVLLSEILPDHEDAGKLALGTRRGAEGEAVHPRDLREHLPQLVEDGEESLHGLLRLEGVSMPHPVRGGDQLRDLRVVLHRAAPQRIHSELH